MLSIIIKELKVFSLIMTCCWWCTEPIEGNELHMPYKFNQELKEFHTTGMFCSWGCMKAYAVDKYSQNRWGEYCMYIHIMRKMMTGKTGPLKGAPTRYALQKFGGPMSIQEFRKNDNPKDKEVILVTERHKLFIEVSNLNSSNQTKTIQTVEDNANRMKHIVNVNHNTTTDTLKLKRTKPLQRDTSSTLETSLGIRRKT